VYDDSRSVDLPNRWAVTFAQLPLLIKSSLGQALGCA
jgi:hypothetical protein